MTTRACAGDSSRSSMPIRRTSPNHLRHAVSLARAHQEPLDWYRLLRDVLGWDNPSHYVQRRLARDFWKAPHDVFASEGETPR